MLVYSFAYDVGQNQRVLERKIDALSSMRMERVCRVAQQCHAIVDPAVHLGVARCEISNSSPCLKTREGVSGFRSDSGEFLLQLWQSSLLDLVEASRPDR